MNLVIDDAVEVKQATKIDPEEKRRELGTALVSCSATLGCADWSHRSNTAKRRQCISHPSFAMTHSRLSTFDGASKGYDEVHRKTWEMSFSFY